MRWRYKRLDIRLERADIPDTQVFRETPGKLVRSAVERAPVHPDLGRRSPGGNEGAVQSRRVRRYVRCTAIIVNGRHLAVGRATNRKEASRKDCGEA